jgi:hypothetical protein
MPYEYKNITSQVTLYNNTTRRTHSLHISTVIHSLKNEPALSRLRVAGHDWAADEIMIVVAGDDILRGEVQPWPAPVR